MSDFESVRSEKTRIHPDVAIMRVIADDIPSKAETDHKTTDRREKRMAGCEKCKLRARYDKNPQSILGRLWHWHIGWCPGWKSYIKSVPEEKRRELVECYGS